jgi:hypothetical protein
MVRVVEDNESGELVKWWIWFWVVVKGGESGSGGEGKKEWRRRRRREVYRLQLVGRGIGESERVSKTT